VEDTPVAADLLGSRATLAESVVVEPTDAAGEEEYDMFADPALYRKSAAPRGAMIPSASEISMSSEQMDKSVMSDSQAFNQMF